MKKEFHVFGPFDREEVFYYADVVSVKYKPAKYITGKQRGWFVTITSRYGKKKTYVLAYEINRTKRETKDTPFNIIEQRMPSAEGEENV